MPLLLAALALAPPAAAAEVQWRAALGAQLDSDSHAIADVGVRSGPWSVELLTETLDLRYAPSGDHGRAWIALRAEAAATGLFISPWTDGAPDPARALLSHALGVEAGALRYLPHGLYIGATGGLRYQLFGPTATTTIPVPAGRPVATGDAVLGWWSEHASAWTRAGADAWLEPTDADAWLEPTDADRPRLAPHAALQAQAAPAGTLVPVAQVWLGAAQGQDDLTLTRLGGMTPYVVPLAGAAWAEWRVQDYAAVRAGLRLALPVGNGGQASLMPFADAAVAAPISSRQPDGPWGLGLGLWGRWSQGRSTVDLAGGYAPWILRQPGISPLSMYLRIDVAWGAGPRLWRTTD